MKLQHRIAIFIMSVLTLPVLAGGVDAKAIVHPYVKAPKPIGVSVTMYPGSMRANITRLAHYFGWKTVKWLPNVDYTWVGKTRVHADSFQDVLAKVLKDFPLQAQFYQGNHVLVMATRTVK